MEQPIAIVVLNWNGLEVTLDCLEALKEQTYTNLEIHLVDNGSMVSEKEALRGHVTKADNIVFYDNPKNLGFAKGVNQVLKKLVKSGKFEFVALLNNDTVPDKNWIAALLNAAKNRGLDMVASKQLFYENPQVIDNAGLTLLSTTEVLPIGAREYSKDFEASFECLCPSAGAGLYKLKVFEEVGFFSTKFKTCYEDAELGLRAALAGFKCGFEPNAKVKHRVSYSVNRIKKSDYGITLQYNMLITYFGLMPKRFKIIHGWKAVLRSLMLMALGVLTFRGNLIKSQVFGWQRFLKDKKALKSSEVKLSNQEIEQLHTPILKLYFKYLKQFIFSGKPTVLE